MAFPSETTVAAWNSGEEGAGLLRYVMGWAENGDELMESLTSKLGTDPDKHYRILSFLTDDDLGELIRDLVITTGVEGVAGRPLTFVKKS